MSITRTEDELSIVCAQDAATGLSQGDNGWRAIKVQGPFAFDQTGILASFLDPLAGAAIGIFAVSTFDTDYILVKTMNLENAVQVLKEWAEAHPTGWPGAMRDSLNAPHWTAK